MSVIVDSGEKTQIELKEPVFYSGEVRLLDALPYDRDNTGVTYLYDIKIRSSKGAVKNINGMGDRYLGVFVRLELPEVKAPEVVPEEESQE
jgi:hypothetical protein